MKKNERNEKRKKIPKWIIITIIVYILLFTIMSYSRHNNFNSGWDLGIQEQLLVTSLRGQMFYSPEFQMNYLGNHFNLIIAPLLPIYYIFTGTTTLFFIQSLAIAAGMIPLYLLSKKYLPEKFASIITAIYILQPTLWHINLGDVHFIALSIPLIIFLFYFIDEKKWTCYWIFLSLLLMIKEDLSLFVFFMGIYLLFKKEKRKALITMVIGAFWFLIIINEVMPLLNTSQLFGSGYIFYNIRYGYLGNSLGEIVHNLITSPWFYFTYVPLEYKFFYIFQFMRGLLFIPIASFSIITAIPIMGVNVMSVDYFQMCLTSHHNAQLIPVLMVSLVFGMSWLKKKIGLDWMKKLIILMLVINIILAAMYGLFPYINSEQERSKSLPEGMACYKNEYRIDGSIKLDDSQIYHKDLNAKIKELDKNKTIAASTSIYPHLLKMKDAKSVHLQKDPYDEDLLLFDFSATSDLPTWIRTTDLKKFIEENNGYKTIWNKEKIYLLEKIS